MKSSVIAIIAATAALAGALVGVGGFYFMQTRNERPAPPSSPPEQRHSTASEPKEQVGAPTGDEVRMISETERLVVKNFLDPDSAKFRSMRVHRRYTDQTYVCGEVNGKNAYGAYVGYRLFYRRIGDDVVMVDDGTPGFNDLVKLTCGMYTLDEKGEIKYTDGPYPPGGAKSDLARQPASK